MTKGSSAPRRLIPSHFPILLLLLLSLLALTIPGCSGCNNSGGNQAKNKNKNKDKDKKKEKRKPDFEVGRLRVQPNDTTSMAQNAVKPGHYITTTQNVKANNFDFAAEIQSASVDRNGRSILIERTPYEMTVSRPAALPKGQNKSFEMTYYIPRPPGDGSGEVRAVWLHSQLRARRAGREVASGMQPTTTMPAHQYYMVVLSANPEQFAYLKRLDSVMPPSNDLDENTDIVYYKVMLPKVDKGVPLPSYSLTWTSIGYLVWDEMNPDMLTPSQQDALLDWLHYGGQIIVSGPGSLDLLRGSFLDSYLPAEKTKAMELGVDSFAELNKTWSLHNKRTNESLNIDVAEKPRVGVELKLRQGARFLPQTGELVAERMVSRGRIVVTAFSLTDRKIVNWGSYDSFFNSCLLCRPHRIFVKGPDSTVRASFANLTISVNDDPRMSTALRYFSRDIAPKAADMQKAKQSHTTLRNIIDDWRFSGFGTFAVSGVGGWNDFSGAANAARQALQEAAGISIPKAGFVLRIIVVYLVFLVPVNWCLFRLMGRVEWAWVAAAVIAIVGSVAVVKLAQLDIGFARSRTEASVLELQGGYRRGHLTRYMALYTSLSTTFDFYFDDESAVAQPFADPRFVLRAHDTVHRVDFRRDKQVRLTGFTIPSNKTRMVHCEQMLALEGPISLVGDTEKGLQLDNKSELTIKDAGVLWRGLDGALQVAYLGDVRARTAVPLNFRPMENEDKAELLLQEWSKSEVLSGAKVEGPSLAGLRELAAKGLRLRDGETRLVGWTDENIKGTTIRPQAPQETMRTLILVHLQHGPIHQARPDVNLRIELDDRKRALTDEDLVPIEDAIR